MSARLTSWSRAGPRAAPSVGPPSLYLAWVRRQRQRRDGAVREGQALLSDLRYSVSQAGLGKGGRHGRGGRRRSQGNFLRGDSLPFPPSFLAGRISSRGLGETKKPKKPKARTGQHIRDLHLFGKGAPEPPGSTVG